MKKISWSPKATGLWHRWMRFSTIANSSGEAHARGQLWEEYFADPSQWWDNRIVKRNQKSPDFRHKTTKEALWVDVWSTPLWVKAKLTQTPSQPRRGRGESALTSRSFQFSNGKENSRPTIKRELNQIPVSVAVSKLKNDVAEGITVDSSRYLAVLESCYKHRDLLSTKEVHECSKKTGMEQNRYVANNLLRVYIRCGRIQEARQVFDNLKNKSVVSWNSMIGGYAQQGDATEALKLLNQMDLQPNEVTYLSILASRIPLREVHAHIKRSGFESNVRVGTALLKLYAKSGSITEARQVFENLSHRDIISWTVMIGAYAENNDSHEADSLFHQMQQQGHTPDAVIYLSLLNQGEPTLEWVKQVHTHALKQGLLSDVRVATALVNMYTKCGSFNDATDVFDSMTNRNVISWNVLIGAYARSGHGDKAYELFLKMQQEGLVPNTITYISILNPSAKASNWVKDVHRHTVKAGFESDVRVGTALVHMYAKSGSIDDARLVFTRMPQRSIITWNVMIGGVAELGDNHEAHKFLLQMEQEGLKPDAFTYVSILSGDPGLDFVKQVHSHAVKAGLDLELRVGNALIHMYSKSGSIEEARHHFSKMTERDVITWNLLIGGLAEHGYGHEALKLFREMENPDERSFTAALVACSHAGLVEEGRRLFASIAQPTVVHYTCMVDLLGRAGHLQEAELVIVNMPMEPNATTWGALLGACRTHGDLQLAERAAKELLKLDPKDGAVYVLLSNMYAAAGRWDEVSSMRSKMKEQGIRKEPGVSWIEVGNKVHRFAVGDVSHPEAKEIYALLKELTHKCKDEGYVPDTRVLLRNLHEEDKELALCSHSEKLAIAYGLLHTPIGQPIRVHKNLRVCTDCHTATKFISKVTGREIVARDANRFHHFKDGVCTCGDFW